MPKPYEPCLKEITKKSIIDHAITTAHSWIMRLRKAGASRWKKEWKKEVSNIVNESIDLRLNLSHLQWAILAEVIPQSIQSYITLIMDYNDENEIIEMEPESRWYDYCQVCKYILRVVMFPCFDLFDLRDIKNNFVLSLVIQSIHVVPEIRTLLLPATSSMFFSETLARRINALTMLEEFCYNNDCTNYILKQLSLYCTKLRILKIRNSSKVDDSAIKYLLNIENLTFLDIMGSSINIEKYRDILLQFPNISNISWNSPVDKIMKPLKLSLLHKAEIKITRAQILAETCPNLSELTLLPHIGTTNLLPLTELKHLNVLKLHNFNFVDSNMHRILDLIGINLTLLELRSIKNLNIVTIISKCGNLKEMNLVQCEFDTTPPEFAFDGTLPHFGSVERMFLLRNRGARTYYNHIGHYENLRTFYTGSEVEGVDNWIRRAVQQGFENLSELYIHNCHLNFVTASLIVTHCPNLCKLGYTKSWLYWTQLNREAILTYIREQNYDLTLVPNPTHAENLMVDL